VLRRDAHARVLPARVLHGHTDPDVLSAARLLHGHTYSAAVLHATPALLHARDPLLPAATVHDDLPAVQLCDLHNTTTANDYYPATRRLYDLRAISPPAPRSRPGVRFPSSGRSRKRPWSRASGALRFCVVRHARYYT
jgi:hypothetical protein